MSRLEQIPKLIHSDARRVEDCKQCFGFEGPPGVDRNNHTTGSRRMSKDNVAASSPAFVPACALKCSKQITAGQSWKSRHSLLFGVSSSTMDPAKHPQGLRPLPGGARIDTR